MYCEPSDINAFRNHYVFTKDIRWEVKYRRTQYSQSRDSRDWLNDYRLTSQPAA
jgi:hypothetical protein